MFNSKVWNVKKSEYKSISCLYIAWCIWHKSCGKEDHEIGWHREIPASRVFWQISNSDVRQLSLTPQMLSCLWTALSVFEPSFMSHYWIFIYPFLHCFEMVPIVKYFHYSRTECKMLNILFYNWMYALQKSNLFRSLILSIVHNQFLLQYSIIG